MEEKAAGWRTGIDAVGQTTKVNTSTLEEQIAFAQSQLSASDELADNYLKNTDSS